MGIQPAARQVILCPAAHLLVICMLYFRRLGILIILIFPRVAHELAHNNGCGPLS